MAPVYFCIVAKGDTPIFELQLHAASANNKKEELNQFIVHSALDAVDDKMWTTTNLHLKVVLLLIPVLCSLLSPYVSRLSPLASFSRLSLPF